MPAKQASGHTAAMTRNAFASLRVGGVHHSEFTWDLTCANDLIVPRREFLHLLQLP